MIKLDISVALFIYLFCTVIGVLVLWIWMERDSGFSTFTAKRRDVSQCSVCSYVYMDIKNGDFSRCPRCKSINEMKPRLTERSERKPGDGLHP